LGGIYYLGKGTYRATLVFFAGFTMLSTFLFLFIFPAKIAGYTQQAACDYYKSLSGKDIYVETLGFKSYAQYFYFEKQGITKAELENSLNEDGLYHIDALRHWLTRGNIDKPVYFVCKIQHADEFRTIPGMEYLSEKNGFVFLKREPSE
jgi:hypothetical protein